MGYQDAHGHAENIMHHIDYAPARAWLKILGEVLPKFVCGYLEAYKVGKQLENAGAIENYSDWIKQMEFGGEEPALTPMLGCFYTHCNVKPNERESHYSVVEKMCQELNSLGCHVAVAQFNTSERGLVIEIQYSLFMPHMKFRKAPIGIPDGPSRDVEGAWIFLAYLLDKGFITEAEITEDASSRDWPGSFPFNKFQLMMAKTPDIQAKIRSLHSELEMQK